MTTTLTRSPEAFNHLLAALQKARSIARENDSFDLLGPNEHLGLPGLDPIVADDRTVLLLTDLATGERECDPVLWMNLAFMVDRSPSWGVGLMLRGVEMPSRSETMQQMMKEATR